MKKAVIAGSMALISVAGFASVPPLGKVTDDTAIHQNLSEITAPRQGKLSFDEDILRLNRMEARYRERLPKLADRAGIAAPMKRISVQKYRPSAPRKAVQASRPQRVAPAIAPVPAAIAPAPEPVEAPAQESSRILFRR